MFVDKHYGKHYIFVSEATKMKLVIVESPAKCTTIKRYLGDNYVVMASLGHIRDLATSGKDGLGVNIADDFSPTYIINKDKQHIVKELKHESGHVLFDLTLINGVENTRARQPRSLDVPRITRRCIL